MSLTLCVCVTVFFIYFGSTLISLIKHLFQASLSNASKKKKKRPKKYADCQKTEDKTKIWLCIAKFEKSTHTHVCFSLFYKSKNVKSNMSSGFAITAACMFNSC